MAEDWAVDVRKYDADADPYVITGIVNYCGIALRNRDSQLVSFSDSTETDRVRENFLKKKMGLADPDAALDASIAAIGQVMKADTTKNRVTVYYLLAKHYSKLEMFVSAKAAKERAAAAAVLPLAAAAIAPVAAAAPAPVAKPVTPPAPAPVAPVAAMAAAAPVAAPVVVKPKRAIAGYRPIYLWLPLALVALGGIGIYAVVSPSAPEAAEVVIAAPAAAAIAVPVMSAVPEGAAVVAAETEGVPMLSVYFNVSSSEVAEDFGLKAELLKAYASANPEQQLVVSGYNDPTGDPVANAELSKNRAQSVAAALIAAGIPEASVVLEKPAETSDADVSLENARRVDVVMR